MKKYGDFLGYLILLLIFFSFLSVLIHFIFNYVSIPLQDLLIYLHASCFMLGIVYAFHHERHVRIDIFFQKYTKQKQNKINQLGNYFLLMPFFGFIAVISFNYVLSSWQKLEGSAESGGIPFVFGLKTLILIMPISMLIYTVLKMARRS